MLKYIKQNWLFLLGIIIVSMIVTAYIAYLSRNCTYYGDDLSYTIYSDSIFEALNPTKIHSAFQFHGGGYLCAFLTPLFNYYIPNMLHIHPLDFMGIPQGIIIGIFYCLFLITMTNFSYIFNKSKTSYFIIFTILSWYFIYSILSSLSFIWGMHHSFYRYMFPLLFYGYFWLYLYKQIIYPNKKTNYFKLCLAILCGFLIGNSVEILFISSSIISGLILLYKLMYPSKIKLNKSIYTPMIALFSSITIFVFSPGFKQVAIERGINNLHFNISDLKEFCSIYFNICIQNEIIIWLVFLILLLLSIFISTKKKKYTPVLIPLFMEISILIALFSLVLCGKTFYDEGNFWLAHVNIQALYKISIIYPILILFSYCSKFITMFNKKKKIFLFMNIIIILSCVITCFYLIPQINKYSNDGWYGNGHLLFKVKKTNYIVEKIYRFYHLKNKKVYLPIELTEMEKPPLEHLSWYQGCQLDTSNMCCKYSTYSNFYYPKIYQDKSYYNVEYCFSKTAIEDFYESGGSFSQEEIENPRFSNLYNEDFILKKGQQISPQEIKQNFPAF